MGSRLDAVALLDEMVRRLQSEAEAHPESADDLNRAEQICCEVVRDAAIEDGAAARRIAETVLGRGIRGTP